MNKFTKCCFSTQFVRQNSSSSSLLRASLSSILTPELDERVQSAKDESRSINMGFVRAVNPLKMDGWGSVAWAAGKCPKDEPSSMRPASNKCPPKKPKCFIPKPCVNLDSDPCPFKPPPCPKPKGPCCPNKPKPC